MAKYEYKANALGYRKLDLVYPGNIIKSSEPLVEATWYDPISDAAKEAWDYSKLKKKSRRVSSSSKQKEKVKEPAKASNEKMQKQVSNEDVLNAGVDPERVMQAYEQMDHNDDSQWTKKGTPKLDVLNQYYKEGTLTAAAIKELNLKRINTSDDKQD